MWMLLVSQVVLNLSIIYMHNIFKDLGFKVLFWGESYLGFYVGECFFFFFPPFFNMICDQNILVATFRYERFPPNTLEIFS